MSYGFGLDVLGLIQEQITGKTLSEVMRERIWSKLGMVDTDYDVKAKDANRFAQPLPNDTLTGKPQNMPRTNAIVPLLGRQQNIF